MSVINPYTLSGFEVLVFETDKKTIQHHAYVLFQNSYRVTTAMKTSEALSMIINRRTFDCILVDGENRDMDLMEFIHNVRDHQPHMRIVVMTSNESHMKIGSGNLENNLIWFLRKPIGGNGICNALQHVCLSKVLGEGISNGMPSEENRNCNVVQKVGTLPPPTLFNTLINNNTLSSNETHQGLNINTKTSGAMCNIVSHVDISSDDEANTDKSIRTRKPRNKDKGKKPMELKRKNDPRPTKVDIKWPKKEEINSRVVWTPTLYRNYLEPLTSSGKEVYDIYSHVAWTPALGRNYLEPLTSFGKEGAHPKEIRNPMNMPDRTCAQVASPLHEVLLGPMKNNIDMQIEIYNCKRSGLSTLFDNNASMQNSSSIQRALNHNSNVTSVMTFDEIMAQGGPQLSLPQPTITTINNSTGDQIQPLIGNTFMSSDFVFTGNSQSGGSAVKEGLAAPVDCYGIPVVSHVTFGGGGESSSNVGSLDNVTLPNILQDFEDILHPQPFLGIGEALLGFLNTDTVNIGQPSTSVSPPSISGLEIKSEEEIQPSGNSILPLDGSEGRVIDNDWYLNLIHDFDF